MSDTWLPCRTRADTRASRAVVSRIVIRGCPGMAKSSRVTAVVHAVLGFQLGAEVSQALQVPLLDGAVLHQGPLQSGERRILLRDQLKASPVDLCQMPCEILVFLRFHSVVPPRSVPAPAPTPAPCRPGAGRGRLAG